MDGRNPAPLATIHSILVPFGKGAAHSIMSSRDGQAPFELLLSEDGLRVPTNHPCTNTRTRCVETKLRRFHPPSTKGGNQNQEKMCWLSSLWDLLGLWAVQNYECPRLGVSVLRFAPIKKNMFVLFQGNQNRDFRGPPSRRSQIWSFWALDHG